MSSFLNVQHETFDADDIESNNTSIKDMKLLYHTVDKQDVNLLVRLLYNNNYGEYNKYIKDVNQIIDET
jgi:hypothetical protein